MSTYDPETRDKGLAAERTDLSWSRSGLSLLACGVAVLRGIARPPLQTGRGVTGACILALGGFVWMLGEFHARRVRGARPAPATRADLLPLACGVALVGVAAFAVAAFFPS